MPRAGRSGSAQDAAQMVSCKLKTFLPEAHGITVPLKAQPRDVAVNAPLLWMFSEMGAPSGLVSAQEFAIHGVDF